MTNKERVTAHCKEHLTDRNLINCFDSTALNYIFTKHNGTTANAYILGLKAADYMILNPPKNFTV